MRTIYLIGKSEVSMQLKGPSEAQLMREALKLEQATGFRLVEKDEHDEYMQGLLKAEREQKEVKKQKKQEQTDVIADRIQALVEQADKERKPKASDIIPTT